MMKIWFTLLLTLIMGSARAQTPLAQVFHGCGGATVAAFAGDATWRNVTYSYQKQTGITWTTVLTTLNNWYVVPSGEVNAPTAFRVVLLNNNTQEERISNGVTVNPSLFANPIPAPSIQAIPNWGLPSDPNNHYFEIRIGSFNSQFRPPFTIEYKKVQESSWQSRTTPTGIFITGVEANELYQFRLTDQCGNVATTTAAVLSEVTFAQLGYSCTGTSITIGLTGSAGLSNRGPFQFACSRIPGGVAGNEVPNSILDTLTYNFEAGTIADLPTGTYVLRARDVYGTLSAYRVVQIGFSVQPFVIGFAPGNSFCTQNLTLANPGGSTGPFVAGFKVSGTNNPYVFGTDLILRNLQGGIAYDVVLRDQCGNNSSVLQVTPSIATPLINNILKQKTGCSYRVTVDASVCSNLGVTYTAQRAATGQIFTQNNPVFSNLEPGLYYFSVETTGNPNSSTIAADLDSLFAIVDVIRPTASCGEVTQIQVDALQGTPPYSYAISSDGIHFTPFSSSFNFPNLKNGTYTIQVKDACGTVYNNALEPATIGAQFYIKTFGFRESCTSSELLGGYIQVGVVPPTVANAPISTGYNWTLREVLSVAGQAPVFGAIVRSGRATDTVFQIESLPGDLTYALFITDDCGEEGIPLGRGSRLVQIPAGFAPFPDITVQSTSCAQPTLRFDQIPMGTTISVFSGRDTLGTPVAFQSPQETTALLGGYYTIKFAANGINGCKWEQVNERYINTPDSTSPGTSIQFENNICIAGDRIIDLKSFLNNATPGGTWISDPGITWLNRDSGLLRTTDLTEGWYQFEYGISSTCGFVGISIFRIQLSTAGCTVKSTAGEVESAQTPLGCKSYQGDQWYHLSDEQGNLTFSINPGIGNQLSGVCWGAKFVVELIPRSTLLGAGIVYFTDRNYYIEPASSTIGANPVKVRLYFTPQEIDRFLQFLQANGFVNASLQELKILKKQAGPGSPVNLNLDYDPGSPLNLYQYLTPVIGTTGDLTYFEIEVSGFSEISVAFPSNGQTLPVTWNKVEGQLKNGRAEIKWSTSSESNTQKFELEHSWNAIDFVKIFETPAAGYSTTEKVYGYLHTGVVWGRNYYRIKQVDRDGRLSYSSVVSIQKWEGGAALKVWPNPVQDRVTISFAEEATKTSWRLYSLQGQLLREGLVPDGAKQYAIAFGTIKAGLYLLQIVDQSGIQSFKLIKQ